MDAYYRHVANLHRVLRRRTELSMVELDCGHVLTMIKDVPPVGEQMWCYRCAKGQPLNMEDFDEIVARNERYFATVRAARATKAG